MASWFVILGIVVIIGVWVFLEWLDLRAGK
ncbi:hypothetical protein LCGC14_1113740 [marine sediment metagenome]|uniref:Uncharacterized protein n=1 Tax=marine sediment metagenome TaxID=412755 RepID=A0A0F9M624_9ZZZZ